MKILADVNISPKTIAFLNGLGHKVLPVTDFLSPTATDQEIVRLATKLGFIILSHDLDFSDLIAQSDTKACSVILLRLNKPSSKSVNSRLQKVMPFIETELSFEKNVIVSVTETMIRVRQFELP